MPVEFFWQLDGVPPLNFVDIVLTECPEKWCLHLGSPPAR